jgi:hypothetical protein
MIQTDVYRNVEMPWAPENIQKNPSFGVNFPLEVIHVKLCQLHHCMALPRIAYLKETTSVYRKLIYFLILYLTTLLVAETMQRRMLGWLMHDEFEGVWKEAVMA